MLTQGVPHSVPDASSEMVSWFLKETKVPLKMEHRTIGAHSYFLCISVLNDNDVLIPVCGRGQTKLEAATRCIGEYLERKAVFHFFRTNSRNVDASLLTTEDSGGYQISSNRNKISLLPKEFWTTNGWAVHTDEKKALRNSLDEAMERSLLMASFLRWGWQGFIELGRTKIDGLNFQSCISRYRTADFSAGFAIGKTDGINGASFGHFCEQTVSIRQSPKWSQALYESADKLKPDFQGSLAHDSIAEDVEWYLKNEVPMELSDSNTIQEELHFSKCHVVLQDLRKIWNLPFPLYSAFVLGGDLVPLFLPREITLEGREYVESKAKSLDFEITWPERVPVL